MWKKLIGLGMMAAGIVFLLIPTHMQMSGVVLLGVGGGILLCPWLRQKGKEGTADMLIILIGSGVICLMAAMSVIFCSGFSDWEGAAETEYAIVLGAVVKEDGQPSRILNSRIDTAMEYLERNPSGIVIVSGGMGDDEPVSEGECMRREMLRRGADPERVIAEEQATTSRENLIYSMEIINARGGTDKPIALVTSEFHLRRGQFIASTLNIETVPLAAKTKQPFYRVHYSLREVFAFVKAAVQGREN